MKLRRDIFQAISDPTRRAILVMLTSQTMTAGAIAENFDAARPTISKPTNKVEKYSTSLKLKK